MKVRVLPDALINQIAAGEVVERPSSVVRELVDNAIDAGATEIVVRLQHGGHALIAVSDDGCGMSRDDALLALERHATSKIQAIGDLQHISSMGFRGEALPSIAAVSKLRLLTRERDGGAEGTEIIVEGGAIKRVSPSARAAGTDVEVARLFFNTPARRKFLKSPKTEELRVRQWMLHSALARPWLRYRLFSDDREVLNLPKRETYKSRAKEIFGGVTVDFNLDDEVSELPSPPPGALVVRGLVAHPSAALADTSALVLLVNGRMVSDRMLLKAVREGFDSTLKDREYPVGFVSLEISPELVDVNVHPQKSEVRFRDAQAVYVGVRNAVLAAVRRFRAPARAVVGNAALGEPARAFSPAPLVRTHAEIALQTGFEGMPELPPAELPAVQGALLEPQREERGAVPFRFSDLRYIGQALQCYLLCEKEGELHVVDMHAAHERYNYNLVRNGFRSRAVASQRLLVPLTVDLPLEAVRRVGVLTDDLDAAGFDIEAFGEATVIVRAAPALVKGSDLPLLVREIAADGALGTAALEERIDHLAARIACHGSIRSGEDLTREEVYALFEALDRSEFSAACPHGRPVIVKFTESDIERWFGRDR